MEGDPRTLEEIGLPEGILASGFGKFSCAEAQLGFFIERKLRDLVPVRSAVATNAETEMEKGPASI